MSVYVLTIKSNHAYQKVIDYYRQKSIAINVFMVSDSNSLSPELIKKLLIGSLNGFDDLLAKKSYAYQRIHNKIGSMSTKTLITYIVENPTVLKYPIICRGNAVYAGLQSIGIDEKN